MTHRVAITGMGYVLPLGTSRPQIVHALAAPYGPFAGSGHDPEVAVCPVENFSLQTYTGRCKNARYLSRGQQLCLAAGLAAVEDAGLHGTDLDRAGLFVGLGPNLEARPRDDRALWLLDWLPNTVTATLAARLGLHGENLTILTACAASTQALGQAYRSVAAGLCAVALAGGGDSRLSPEGVRAYRQAGVLATGWSRPELACRPFDQDRTGFAIGEGGAMFVLEELDRAEQRGATILAEITGAAASLDGAALTGPDPNGRAASRAVTDCLRTMGTGELCVIAHGTGTVLNDAVESRIIAATAPDVHAVCAFKSRIGHLAAACGAAELALALICAVHGTFPSIAGLKTPCHDLPLLRQAASLRPRRLLLQSFGFGGQNACLGVRTGP